MELLSQFVKRFSIFISTTKVISVKQFFYSGHVYDLQADVFQLYIANGVIVKNCLCYDEKVIPNIGDAPDAPTIKLEDVT